jgi:phage I-like protein
MDVREQFRAQHLEAQRALRLAVDLYKADGAVKHRIQILPPGPIVAARDGRMFSVTDLPRVVSASEVPMLVDWEHNSERWDGSTRAAGWLESLEINPSEKQRGLWGRVRWTDAGQKDIDSKAYRYLSPVLLLDGESRDVLQVVSVALTNKPALAMAEISAFSVRTPRVAVPTPETGLTKEVLARLRSNGCTDEEILETEAYLQRMSPRRVRA